MALLTRSLMSVTQAGVEVVEAMVEAHSLFFDTLTRTPYPSDPFAAEHNLLDSYRVESRRESRELTSDVPFVAFDLARSRLRYHLHDFQGLMLLARALDDRIQNSIALVGSDLSDWVGRLLSNQAFNTVSKQDSLASIELAKAATRDSRSMKVIAFATVVFLPGTFLAVSLNERIFSWIARSL